MGWENIIKDDSPLTRSMQFLQGMADELGVRILINSHHSVVFSYGGLRYEMEPTGLVIHIGSKYIYICVKDERKLPLGDYYASLLGLIVNDPSRIPTLDFGIKLGRILAVSGRRLPSVNIFTPFGSKEEDSQSFKNFIRRLKKTDSPYLLGQIRNALVESFGDDRGFF